MSQGPYMRLEVNVIELDFEGIVPVSCVIITMSGLVSCCCCVTVFGTVKHSHTLAKGFICHHTSLL